VRKLTDSDKTEILKLYRETAETTSTLAERYGVSNSTISRLLKGILPEEDYEYLVSLKRAARTPEGRALVSYEQLPLLGQSGQSQEDEIAATQTPVEELEPPKVEVSRVDAPQMDVSKPVTKEIGDVVDIQATPIPAPIIRRVKTRSSATDKPPLPVSPDLETIKDQPTILEETDSQASIIANMFGDDLLDDSEDLDDLDDDLYEDEEDFEEEEFERPTPFVTRPRAGDGSVQILPLSVAALPKTCYLVIDRCAELITRPLKDFGDLGAIPIVETQQRTLPVFDNHRVAKRFSTKRDRVIRIPDSRVLHKTSNHLQAKGITRLLIDGQVYSLT